MSEHMAWTVPPSVCCGEKKAANSEAQPDHCRKDVQKVESEGLSQWHLEWLVTVFKVAEVKDSRGSFCRPVSTHTKLESLGCIRGVGWICVVAGCVLLVCWFGFFARHLPAANRASSLEFRRFG